MTKCEFQVKKWYLVSVISQKGRQGGWRRKPFFSGSSKAREKTCLLLQCWARNWLSCLPGPLPFLYAPFWTRVRLTFGSDAYLLHLDHRLPLLRKRSSHTIIPEWLYLQHQIHLAQQMFFLKSSVSKHPPLPLLPPCVPVYKQLKNHLVEFQA